MMAVVQGQICAGEQGEASHSPYLFLKAILLPIIELVASYLLD